MSAVVLRAAGLSKRFGATVALDGAGLFHALADGGGAFGLLLGGERLVIHGGDVHVQVDPV